MTALLSPQTSKHDASPDGPHSEEPSPRRTSRRRGDLAVLVLLFATPIVLVGLILAFAMGGSKDQPHLVVDGTGALSAIDSADSAVSYTLDGAVVSADGSTIFQSRLHDNGGTEVSTVDIRSGEPTSTVELPFPREIRTVSPFGDAVALLPVASQPSEYGDGTLFQVEPRERTAIDVLFANGEPAKSFDLEGNFEPETFSVEADVLYLLEFVPAENPDHYFVRQLDLATGEIATVYSPNVELAPEMRGKARTQTFSPEFDFLYTLYTLDAGDEPLRDPADADNPERRAFIHVLSLREDWSFCIFLPLPIGLDQTDTLELSMAVSPDGRTIFVVDRATSTIVVVDTDTFSVRDTVASPRLFPTDDENEGRNKAVSAVGPDGLLYTASAFDLLAFGPSLTAPSKVWWVDGGAITDIDASVTGSEIRVAVAEEIVIFDTDLDRVVSRMAVPEAGSPDQGVRFVGASGSAVSLSVGKG